MEPEDYFREIRKEQCQDLFYWLLIFVFQVVLVILKLTNIINWDWFSVLSPLWGYGLVFLYRIIKYG